MSPEGGSEGRELPPGQRATPRWRASTYGRVPVLDPLTWELTVTGRTASGADLTLDHAALEAMPQREVRAGLHCVDRHSVPDLTWSGVALRDVVALAPPAAGVGYAVLAAARGYSTCVRVEDLLAPDALLATRVDGEPLTPEHGWPVRVVLPHLYGYKGPKWVVELAYRDEPAAGWWESHGYHPRGRVDREERWGYQA